VLVGGVVGGAVVVAALEVGAVVSDGIGAGATGAAVVVLVGADVVVGGVVVTAADVVGDVDGDVEPPPFVSSMMPRITSASRMATTATIPIKTAGLRCHGADSGSGSP
jgi:hypothetical protein